ncbi:MULTISPECIES: cation:proton antiporter [Caldisericum]|jgi:Kef-type K+ transport system membrane component KefB|uniref:cation:proton antiporter domain-containing protein n=1 Tax=Caldisericum TaxID=693074 RepID=UPI003C74933E
MEEVIIFIAISVISGLILSYILSKSDFPTITGLIIIGIVISFIPTLDKFLTSFGSIFKIIIELAINILLFETGLEIIYLKYNKKIILSAIAQSFFTFLIIFLISKIFFKLAIIEGILIAIIWMVTGSDIAITLIRKLKVNQDTKLKLGAIVVFDDLIAEIFFFLFFPLLKFKTIFQNEPTNAILLTVGEIILSIALGILLGLLFSRFERYGFNKFPQIITSFSFILLFVGISEYLKLHSIVVSLIAGIVFSNTSKNEIIKIVRFSLKEIDQIFYTLFIIYSISYVGLIRIEKFLLPSILILFIRLIGKSVGAIIIQKLKIIETNSIKNIIITLIPQSMLSAYFAYLSGEYLTIFGTSIFTATITSIIMFEILGYYLIKKFALNE